MLNTLKHELPLWVLASGFALLALLGSVSASVVQAVRMPVIVARA